MITNRLKDKVAIITGASRGIGKAIAELFLEEGASLVVTAIKNTDTLNEFSKIAGKIGRKVAVVKADLSIKQEINNILKEALSAFGKVDILVNNAGIFEQLDFEEISEDQFDNIMNINLRGAFFLTQAVIEQFKKQKYGKIVNISSLSGKIGSSNSPHYASSKAGLIALTKSLARRYGRFNININAVAPSLIETDMIGQIPSSRLDNLVEAVPLKRLGRPREVANLVLFLASNSADYINGQCVCIDGGIGII